VQVVVFTGYEVNSVRALADGGEESVPITEQYNHHHNAYVLGQAAALVDVGPAGSGKVAMRRSPCTELNPTAVFLVDGNGGEYRMSLHGTSRGTNTASDGTHSPGNS
jgi:hypothetical protein